MESRSSGVGTKFPLSLDRKGKVLVEFRKKVGDLWVASCGSPRVLAPWVCLEAEVEGNESGSCRVCIRNLMTKVARCFLAVFLTIVEVKEESGGTGQSSSV